MKANHCNEINRSQSMTISSKNPCETHESGKVSRKIQKENYTHMKMNDLDVWKIRSNCQTRFDFGQFAVTWESNICVTITTENNGKPSVCEICECEWMKKYHYKRGDKSRPNRKYIDTATVNKIYHTDQFPLFGSASFISWNRLFSLAFSCSSPFSWKFLICFQFDQTKYLNDMWLVHTKFMPQISQWSIPHSFNNNNNNNNNSYKILTITM